MSSGMERSVCSQLSSQRRVFVDILDESESRKVERAVNVCQNRRTGEVSLSKVGEGVSQSVSEIDMWFKGCNRVSERHIGSMHSHPRGVGGVPQPFLSDMDIWSAIRKKNGFLIRRGDKDYEYECVGAKDEDYDVDKDEVTTKWTTNCWRVSELAEREKELQKEKGQYGVSDIISRETADGIGKAWYGTGRLNQKGIKPSCTITETKIRKGIK